MKTFQQMSNAVVRTTTDETREAIGLRRVGGAQFVVNPVRTLRRRLPAMAESSSP